MAMMGFAMWLQDADPGGTRHLILIAVGLMAVAVAAISVIMLVIAIKAMKTIKELGNTAEEIKGKVMPLLDEVMAISKTSREMLQDAAPKVKVITDSLVEASETLTETSKAARSAVQQLDTTITDVNMRTQRQVARVDGMVTSALTATVDAVETISRGIKVPTQKVVAFAGQARLFAEGLLSRMRSNGARAADDSVE